MLLLLPDEIGTTLVTFVVSLLFVELVFLKRDSLHSNMDVVMTAVDMFPQIFFSSSFFFYSLLLFSLSFLFVVVFFFFIDAQKHYVSVQFCPIFLSSFSSSPTSALFRKKKLRSSFLCSFLLLLLLLPCLFVFYYLENKDQRETLVLSLPRRNSLRSQRKTSKEHKKRRSEK